MREPLDFDAVRAQAQRRACEVRVAAGDGTHKDQPHDDAFWEAQFMADQARLNRRLATGEWVFTGPRSLVWTTPQT
jgi:hypothetical protein